MVTTAADSLQVYKYSVHTTGEGAHEYLLSLISTDSIARGGSCHLAIKLAFQPKTQVDVPTEDERGYDIPNVVIAADRVGNIIGFEPKYGKRYEMAARTMFEAALPQYVTKLVQGDIRPPWRRINNPDVLADNILGSTMNGTFYSFCVIGNSTWVLLKFLENLCTWDRQAHEAELREEGKRHSSLTPGLSRTKPPLVTIDPEREPKVNPRLTAKRKTQNHINGDILEPLLRIGGRARVLRMLNREETDSDPSEQHRGNSKDARVRRFLEIIEGIKGFEAPDLDVAVGCAIDVLREVMTPMF